MEKKRNFGVGKAGVLFFFCVGGIPSALAVHSNQPLGPTQTVQREVTVKAQATKGQPRTNQETGVQFNVDGKFLGTYQKAKADINWDDDLAVITLPLTLKKEEQIIRVRDIRSAAVCTTTLHKECNGKLPSLGPGEVPAFSYYVTSDDGKSREKKVLIGMLMYTTIDTYTNSRREDWTRRDTVSSFFNTATNKYEVDNADSDIWTPSFFHPNSSLKIFNYINPILLPKGVRPPRGYGVMPSPFWVWNSKTSKWVSMRVAGQVEVS